MDRQYLSYVREKGRPGLERCLDHYSGGEVRLTNVAKSENPYVESEAEAETLTELAPHIPSWQGF